MNKLTLLCALSLALFFSNNAMAQSVDPNAALNQNQSQQNSPSGQVNNDPNPNPTNPAINTQQTKEPVPTDADKAAPRDYLKRQEEQKEEDNKKKPEDN